MLQSRGIPHIRIRASFLLNNAVVPLLKPALEKAGRSAEADPETIRVKVEEYKTAWQEYEDRIVPALCQALGVDFAQNTIDAYVAPFDHSFSDPMVISTKHSGDRFIEVFTHELSHCLLTDNTAFQFETAQRKIGEAWAELFGADHSFITLVHIPVHALLEYVFSDVLNEPRRLQRDKEYMAKYPDYDKAWQYVSEAGYTRILEQLKELYETF